MEECDGEIMNAFLRYFENSFIFFLGVPWIGPYEMVLDLAEDRLRVMSGFGILERMDESLEVLNSISPFGVDIDIPHLNQTVGFEKPGPEMRQCIEGWVGLDGELYRRALRMFDKKVSKVRSRRSSRAAGKHGCDRGGAVMGDVGEKDVRNLLADIVELAGSQEIAAEDAAKVNENIGILSGIVSKVELAVRDGLQWADLTVIGRIVPEVMRLAAGFSGYKGLDKRRFVIEVVWLVYRMIDTFPDGKRNNIDVPWVAGPIERKLERAVVSFAAGMAVDALFPKMRSAGEV
jgi:hypothetical protein